jgi:tRNA nucleotidyltransferase/poly(A) polymerase
MNFSCRNQNILVQILGVESKDIDIALDNIPIDDFVAAIRRLKHPLVENVAQNENRELRTVMITICGEQVEFVNLRTNGFGIPDVPPELPTGALDPWIDAHLRDLTINVRGIRFHPTPCPESNILYF